jgi:hypothetical protein
MARAKAEGVDGGVARMTSVNPEDITKPGGMQRLLESATADEGHTAIMCEQHGLGDDATSVEMTRDGDEATCPTCGNVVRLAWVPE